MSAQRGPQCDQDGPVRGDPRKVLHIGPCIEHHPSQLIVILQRGGNPGDRFDDPDTHRGLIVDGPSLVPWTRDLDTHLDLDSQLLIQLAVQSRLAGLTGLDLPARELPHAGELGWSGAPRDEELGGVLEGVDDSRSDDLEEPAQGW